MRVLGGVLRRAFSNRSSVVPLPIAAATVCMWWSCALGGVTIDSSGTDRAGRVGAFSSLVVGPSEVAVGYYCEKDSASATANEIRFAWKSGECWQRTLVASGGSRPSMARDASGTYHIIYETPLGLAWSTGYASQWTTAPARVDSAIAPSHASIALDSQGHPHVAYFESSESSGSFELRYTRWDGAAWVRGPCEIVSNSAWVPTMGSSNAFLALDSADVPHVAFAVPADAMDPAGTIMFATLQGGSWTVEPLGTTGVDPTLRIGTDGVPWVAFRQDDVVAVASRPLGAWQVETVSAALPGVWNVGSISLAIDPTNAPLVSFEATCSAGIYLATRAPSGWRTTLVEGCTAPMLDRTLGRFGIGMGVDPSGQVHLSYAAATIQPDSSGANESSSDLKHYVSGETTGICSLVPGACCTTSTSACCIVLQNACASGRVWNGAISCTPTVCAAPSPLGACCRGNVCAVSTQAVCSGPTRRFLGVGSACGLLGATNRPCCLADIDQNGSIDLQDMFVFLNGWLAGTQKPDSNLSDFLQAWFNGC